MQFKPLPEWWNLYWWSEQFHMPLRAWLHRNTLPKQWVSKHFKHFDRMYAITNVTSEMPGDNEILCGMIRSKDEAYLWNWWIL